MRKRAGIDLTVGKILNIALLSVVLVLVSYGVSQGGLIPLKDKIESKIDSVAIMIGWGDDISSGECYSEKVANFGGGKGFLEELRIGDRDAVLNVCAGRICNISGGGLDSYRVSEGSFEKFEDGEWGVYDSVFVGPAGSIKFNWELYNAGVGILDNIEIKKLYDEGFTQRFVLYGDGAGLNEEIYAVWQNGYWRVVEGRDWENKFFLGRFYGEMTIHYNGTDDDLAIDSFVKVVRGGYDDKVFWKETIPIVSDREYISGVSHGESIETLVGDLGFWGSSDELDDDDEVAKLKLEFAKKKRGYLNDAVVSVDELGEIITAKEVIINGEAFSIEIEKDGNFPIVVFSSSNEKFGLRYGARAKINSNLIEGVKLRYFPVSLVEWDVQEWKEIGNEEYYRLPENYFEEVRRATLISQFLKEKCR